MLARMELASVQPRPCGTSCWLGWQVSSWLPATPSNPSQCLFTADSINCRLSESRARHIIISSLTHPGQTTLFMPPWRNYILNCFYGQEHDFSLRCCFFLMLFRFRFPFPFTFTATFTFTRRLLNGLLGRFVNDK